MPYGKEAKQVLLNLVEGKSLRVLVYDQDRYGCTVGDRYELKKQHVFRGV